MQTAEFDFALPADRIAQRPASPREAAGLLYVTGSAMHDRIVRELPELLRSGDVLVANDTKVIPAQLAARRGGARIGITLDRPDAKGNWFALARNARRLRVGDVLAFDGCDALAATIVGDNGGGMIALRFNLAGAAFSRALQAAGALALPPYIARPAGVTIQDQADYQTIFADHPGAVAAPTAGLHFTSDLLERLRQRGIKHVPITLHVGAGTFLPVRTDDLANHQMHAERGRIDVAAASAINAARADGGRIVAIGTTTLRLLESAVRPDGTIAPFDGETSIFITPGATLRSADLLLTNFHLPRSTLFMLVCAFAGTDRMKAAYTHAINRGYRFYSYGDECLLERA